MKILFFDTESNGIPVWQKPSGSECQPHIVQIAGILYDDETKKIVNEFETIIKPSGWSIPDDVADIHGITTERAYDEGIDEELALDMFLQLYSKCSLRVAHCTTFDNRMIRIALKRFKPDLISDKEWKDRSKYYCTLLNAKKQMGGKSGHKLSEVYLHYTGKTLQNAHTAMPDAKACMEIYLEMIKTGRGK